MKVPHYADAFKVLLLQAAADGRGDLLFGDSLRRAREAVPPFLVGEAFPVVYLEHPLAGAPFLDVTVLLHALKPGMRVESPAAGDHAAMIDWYAETCRDANGTCCGFELDTKEDPLPPAAVHFQPRSHSELVRPFCEAAGEPQRADLYLGMAAHMPDGWPLSFLGMFRGRPESPLRICGYLGNSEKEACAQDPGHLAKAFNAIGFSAYDGTMLSQASALMAEAPGGVDFQFDVRPDGSLGSTFAIDMNFEMAQPNAVRDAFESGACARVMRHLESLGAADGRWRQAVESAFARALPVELGDGETGMFAFVLMPRWLKASWRNGSLQPAKLYHLAKAKLVENAGNGVVRRQTFDGA